MADFPDRPRSTLPAVTTEQMREVDRIMIEDLHIELMQMMENAGRNLARLTIDLFDPRHVAVFAGSGGNGGGGLVAARHLANWDVEVEVVLGSDRGRMTPVPAHQLDVLDRMGVKSGKEPPADFDVAIDALIGYSLAGDPHGRPAELITHLNALDRPVLSLDTPSGLDVTTGTPGNPCVSATATMTLAAPKTGLLSAVEVGDLYLADISVPAGVYDTFGMRMPNDLFRQGSPLRLT